MKQHLMTLAVFLAALVIYDLVLKPILQKQGLATFENAEDDELENI
jgi:hypothetical protein